jgi:ABC-type branched-subunit amino acid transport system ATPase component
MELTLVGLQHSGKTTFVNVIAVSLALVSRNVFEFMGGSGSLERRLHALCE